MNKQASLNILLVGIIIVLSGVIGYLVFVRNALAPTVPEQPATQNDTETPDQSSTPNTETDNGRQDEKTYSNDSFEFTYPPVLTVQAQDGGALIKHAVDYRHTNVCDFKGDAPDLEQITDFNVSLKVFDSGLKDTMRKKEGDDFVASFFQGDTVRIEPGYVEESNIGSLRGYRIIGSFEGCGNFYYYFPLSASKTLFVSRQIVTEFQPIITDYQTYLKVPGVIPPAREENYFQTILSSFKLK